LVINEALGDTKAKGVALLAIIQARVAANSRSPTISIEVRQLRSDRLHSTQIRLKRFKKLARNQLQIMIKNSLLKIAVYNLKVTKMTQVQNLTLSKELEASSPTQIATIKAR